MIKENDFFMDTKYDDQMNNLVELTRQNQRNIINNCKLNMEIANEAMKMKQRSFNFTDFYYILCRSFKSTIIRGWKLEFIKAFCLFCGPLFMMMLFPNDIGLDPSCPIDVLNDFNISEITDQVYDAINGKRSNGEMNVNYMIVLFLYFGFIYVMSVALIFTDEIKVSLFK